MSRKSQLEKFELRMSKQRKDEEVVKETEVKNSTLEKRAGKVANQYGISTEDIFMIIARDSASTFLKMWNNSMENVVRETIQAEVRNVIQEELASAVRGFMKGLSMTNHEMDEEIEEEIEKQAPEIKPFLAFDSKLNEMKVETDDYVKILAKHEEKADENGFIADDEMKEAIIQSHHMGIDVTSAVQFKNLYARNSTLYQRFVKNNAGRRGGWKTYSANVIAEESNEQTRI